MNDLFLIDSLYIFHCDHLVSFYFDESLTNFFPYRIFDILF
ncbi:hypothetical protein ACFPFV_11635 [Salinicoccus siamensis]